MVPPPGDLKGSLTTIDERTGHLKFWKKKPIGIEFVKHFRSHLGPIEGLAFQMLVVDKCSPDIKNDTVHGCLNFTQVHICMSRGETFPNIHGQLDVKGLGFQILDVPSCFSEIAAILCFRGQRIFLHNVRGWFGDVPVESSGDFGINPDDGEFHLMCQV